MKKKITFRIILLIFVALLITVGCACATLLQVDNPEIVANNVINLGTTSGSNGLLTRLVVSHLYDTYSGGNCSVAAKVLSNGDTIVGRNLDMTYSNSPVYIGCTDIEGHYETIYASYVPSFGPDYSDCVENGVPNYLASIMPFIALDSLNSEGLYIQINMRMDQQDDSGNAVFSCEYTNKDADTRISAIELPTYVTLRCKNVAEAVELIQNLDIYTLGGDINWPFSYILADAEGNYGLLELGCNEIRWIPQQNIQTNFYVSEDWNSIQKYKQGLGRYDCLQESLDNVNSEEDMLQLLECVKYSSIYDLDTACYDIRSEMAGDEEYLTNEYLDDEDNWNAYKSEYQEEVDLFQSLNDQEKRDANQYWMSIYTTVANCSQKKLTLCFFEDYTSTFSLDFHHISSEDTHNKYVYGIIFTEILSIIICLILLYGTFFEARKRTESLTNRQKIYVILICCDIIGTTCDLFSWLMDGSMQHPGILEHVTGLSVIFTYILIGLFCQYLYSLLNEKQSISNTAFMLFDLACIIAIVITAVLFKMGQLYIVKDGSYIEAPLYMLYSVFTGIFIVAMVIIVYYYRHILGTHDLIAVSLYVFLPVVSALLSVNHPEIGLGYPTSTLSILIAYIMLQFETTNKLTSEKNASTYRVNHDELTKLPSRFAYVEKIDLLEKQFNEDISKPENNVGVFFADVNGLKYTNDKFGHTKGDELLFQFSNAAREVFPEDCIYRISGDEFVVLLPGISQEVLTEKELQFAKILEGYEPQLACFGRAYGPCNQINELVRAAESEMYNWKIKFYEKHPDMKR